MDGDAVPVSGGDAGRGGIGVSEALTLQLAEIAIDGMGLAAAGLAGQEDARPGLEQGKRLVLGHGLNPWRPRQQGLVPRKKRHKG
jgi:hypothetical protein